MKLVLCTLLGFGIIAAILLSLCILGMVPYRLAEREWPWEAYDWGYGMAGSMMCGLVMTFVITIAYLIGKGICQ